MNGKSDTRNKKTSGGRNLSRAPLPDQRRLAAMIPRSRLVIIEGSGHMAPMEKPTEVTAALRDWLQM